MAVSAKCITEIVSNLNAENLQGQMESVLNVLNFQIPKYMYYCHCYSRCVTPMVICLLQLLESILLLKCSNYLTTCDNQFGFKTSHGTDMCINYIHYKNSLNITNAEVPQLLYMCSILTKGSTCRNIAKP